MGKRYLIDTNIFIRFLVNGLNDEAKRKFIELTQDGFLYSFITRIELLSFPNIHILEEERIWQNLLLGEEVNITEDIILKTIEIRKTKILKIPDAIIAATAVVGDLTLLTFDKKDFTKVQGLKMEVLSEEGNSDASFVVV